MVKAKNQRVRVVEFDYEGRLESAGERTRQLLAAKARREEEKRRLRGVPKGLLEKCAALLPADTPLHQTITSEAIVGIEPDNFRKWGAHYLRTFSQMLRSQRRSNFRDAALQGFGQDATGAPGLFEELSNECELCFAQLPPPQPSGLERMARRQAKTEAEAREAREAAARRQAMPDEFMRGGGCFAPDALVQVVAPDGTETPVPIAALVPFSRVRTASGATAEVTCVVASPCDPATPTLLTELPTGLQLTEWHPVRDSRGRWRFPLLLGRRIARRLPAVYNLVLSREHVALVGGVACVTLGHGLEGPVVGHPFWGGRAVLEQLAAHDGWASGRVLLEAPLTPSGAAGSAAAVAFARHDQEE